MLINAIEMLEKAKKEGYAVPQFNTNNLEWTRYILEEAEELKSPVILGVSEGAAKYMGGYKTVSNITNGLISDLNITVPVSLHLDHGSSIEACKKAIDNGFSSVMIDASNNNIEENIRITKEVVLYAKKHNVSVEAEIGHIGGTEDGVTNEVLHAKLEDCIKLINETDLDFLAPALGSVHGLYHGEPNLDFKRMEEISLRVNKPLVLHGGTGIPDDKIKKAIKNGIAKININTELQIAWSRAIRTFIKENEHEYDPRKIISSGEKEIKKSIKEKIFLFESNNKT